MNIQKWYDSRATISRESAVPGSTIKRAVQTVYTDIPCHVQALSEEFGQMIPGGFGKQFVMFCSNSYTLYEGDTVVISGTSYGVTGVERLLLGGNPHQEVILSTFTK